MPVGMKGFQPGRPKSGGRVSNEEKVRRLEEKIKSMPKSAKLVDQLAVHGFDYYKALAQSIKAVVLTKRGTTPEEVEAYKKVLLVYDELKALLPFMSPKLREKEIDTTEPPANDPRTDVPISDDDLLKAYGGNSETDSRTSNPPSVEPGNLELSVPASTEEDLRNVADLEEEV